jgi:hypothetical protein
LLSNSFHRALLDPEETSENMTIQVTRGIVLGTLFIVAGVSIFGFRVRWAETRLWTPADMPISMAKGRIRTHAFTVNYSSYYLIEIEAQKTVPFETLNCLLGVDANNNCSATPSVVNASWVLTSKGTVVAEGSTSGVGGGGWRKDYIERIVGSFIGERGREYVLMVDVLSDGSALSITHPRLRVTVSPAAYETEAVEDGLVFGTAFVLVIIGTVVLISKCRRRLQT